MKMLIKNGLALLWDGSTWKIEKKDILINANRIESVKDPDSKSFELCTLRREASPSGNFELYDRIIDASGKLVMPGLINAHTHAYMTIHRNVADDLALFDWLDAVQRIEDFMTEEDVYWSTLLAIIEMIRSGTTCFVDMTIKSAK